MLSCSVWPFASLWTVARQAPLSMEFSQQEYRWCDAMPSSRGSSQPRDWTCVSHSAGGFFTTEPLGEAPVSSSVQFSCSVVCHSLRESGGDKGSPFVSREVSKKLLVQPAVTTSPWHGAYPSCLYTEIVECTFPFWFGNGRLPLFLKWSTTQACSNSPSSEPGRAYGTNYALSLCTH